MRLFNRLSEVSARSAAIRHKGVARNASRRKWHNQPSRAFAGFQRNIAGKPVGDDNIDIRFRNIAALDKSQKFVAAHLGAARDHFVGVFQL